MTQLPLSLLPVATTVNSVGNNSSFFLSQLIHHPLREAFLKPIYPRRVPLMNVSVVPALTPFTTLFLRDGKFLEGRSGVCSKEFPSLSREFEKQEGLLKYTFLCCCWWFFIDLHMAYNIV